MMITGCVHLSWLVKEDSPLTLIGIGQHQNRMNSKRMTGYGNRWLCYFEWLKRAEGRKQPQTADDRKYSNSTVNLLSLNFSGQQPASTRAVNEVTASCSCTGLPPENISSNRRNKNWNKKTIDILQRNDGFHVSTKAFWCVLSGVSAFFFAHCAQSTQTIRCALHTHVCRSGSQQ